MSIITAGQCEVNAANVLDTDYYQNCGRITLAGSVVTDCTEHTVTHTQSDDDGVSTTRQLLQDVENRLVTLSEKITMCDKVMNDLKHLKDVLVRKSLRDVALPPQN